MDTSVEKVEDFYLEPILVGQPKVDQWIPNVETVQAKQFWKRLEGSGYDFQDMEKWTF